MSTEEFINCIKDFCEVLGESNVFSDADVKDRISTDEFISKFVLERAEKNRPYVEMCMYIRGSKKQVRCNKPTHDGTVFCKGCLLRKAPLKQLPSMFKAAVKDPKLIQVLTKSKLVLDPNATIKSTPKKPVDDGLMMDRIEGTALMWYRDLNIVFQKLTLRGYIALGGFENNAMPSVDDIRLGLVRFSKLTAEQIEFCHTKNFGVLTDSPEIKVVDAANGVDPLASSLRPQTKTISSFFKKTDLPDDPVFIRQKSPAPVVRKQKNIMSFMSGTCGPQSVPSNVKISALEIDSDDE